MKTPTHETGRGIPTTVFNLAEIPESDRFAVWKESISVIFDVSLDTTTQPQNFTAQLVTRHLGSVLFNNTRSHGQIFQRPSELIAQDGLDHFLLQIYRRGTNAGLCGKIHHYARPGDIFLLDLAQPLATRTTDFDNLTLIIPRALLSQYLPRPERFHGQILRRESPLGRLLATHLDALWNTTLDITPTEAKAMADGLVGLISAYFGQTALSEEVPEIQATLHASIRRYIAQHCTDRQLTPEALAAHFHISRAQLYRLFKPNGGVIRAIQDQRLNSFLAELLKPANRQRSIAELSAQAGFADESHLSRLFRQTFGFSPREFRQGAMLGKSMFSGMDKPIDRSYENWVRHLSGASSGMSGD